MRYFTNLLRRRAKHLMFLGLIVMIPLAVWFSSQVASYARSRELEVIEAESREAYQDRDWATLEELATRWTQLDANAADGWLFLSESQRQLGKSEESLKSLLEIPDGTPKSYASLLVATDLCFNELNRPDLGVGTARRLLETRPSSMAARRSIIFYYATTLQRLKMIDEIYQAIENDSEPPEAYVYLLLADHLSFTNGYATVSRWLGSNELAEQQESETLRVARVLQLLDNLENQETRPQERLIERVAKQKDALIKEFPENLSLYRYQLETAAKNFELDHLQQLLESSPVGAIQDSIYWRYKGWYELQLQRPQDSLFSLKRSLSLFRLDWHTWNDLAATYRQLGQISEAETASQTALMGKELRKTLIQLPKANDLSEEHFRSLLRYAKQCGDVPVSEQLSARLQEMQRPPGEF